MRFLLVTAVLVLVGCGEPLPGVVTTVQLEPAETEEVDISIPGRTGDLLFEMVVAEYAPEAYEHFGANGLTRLAQEACRQADAGDSMLEVSLGMAMFFEDEGLTAGDAGAVMGAGVPAFCPQHQEALDGLIDALS